MFAARYFAERYWPRRYWPAVGAEAPPTPTPTPSQPGAGSVSGGNAIGRTRRSGLGEAWAPLDRDLAELPISGRLSIVLEPFPALVLTGRGQVVPPTIEAFLEVRLPEASVELTGRGYVLTMDDRIRQAVEDHLLALG